MEAIREAYAKDVANPPDRLMPALSTSKAAAKILVAEDEPDQQAIVTAGLESAGYAAVTVISGDLIVEVARAEKPALILLDIAMPRLDGCSVCRLLKADPELAGIPVIARRCSAGTPRPRSVTRNSSQLSRSPTLMVTTPPGGENFTALESRLTRTWTTRSASAQIVDETSGASNRTPWLCPNVARDSIARLRIVSTGTCENWSSILPVFEPFEIQDVVDERNQPDGIPLGDGDDVDDLRGERAHRAGGQEAERSPDRGERRPQLVADRREETLLEAFDFFEALDGLFRDVLGALELDVLLLQHSPASARRRR